MYPAITEEEEDDEEKDYVVVERGSNSDGDDECADQQPQEYHNELVYSESCSTSSNSNNAGDARRKEPLDVRLGTVEDFVAESSDTRKAGTVCEEADERKEETAAMESQPLHLAPQSIDDAAPLSQHTLQPNCEEEGDNYSHKSDSEVDDYDGDSDDDDDERKHSSEGAVLVQPLPKLPLRLLPVFQEDDESGTSELTGKELEAVKKETSRCMSRLGLSLDPPVKPSEEGAKEEGKQAGPEEEKKANEEGEMEQSPGKEKSSDELKKKAGKNITPTEGRKKKKEKKKKKKREKVVVGKPDIAARSKG